MTIYSKVFETGFMHSAKEIGSGELDVLASPALISFIENTAYSYAKNAIDDDFSTTVGSEIGLQHCRASKIGSPVTVVITALKEEGRKYDFRLEAFSGDQQIGKACHTRVKVDKEKFLNKL